MGDRTIVCPIHYGPNFPFQYNNFVYHVNVADGSPTPSQQQPGCVPIPSGTRDFILRLGNREAEGMHGATRVENEVAVMSMAAAALRHMDPPVVPRVFAWGSAADSSQGWILQERMTGTPCDEAFGAMDVDGKKGVVAQMAALLKGLQDYQLPASVRGWGGLTFGRAGEIVSAPMASVGAGPWGSFEQSYVARFRAKLALADASPHIRGWRADGVRERLEGFLETGISAQFASLASREERVIAHGDFNTLNILVDPSSARITALLDYDFSSILHPCYDFLRSMDQEWGQLPEWTGDQGDEDGSFALRKAKLTGTFPTPLPANTEAIQWDLAAAWEHGLVKLDAKRPSTIAGMENIANVDSLLGAVLPWQLSNPDFLHGKGQAEVDQMRRYFGRQLVALMKHMGL